MFTMLSSVMIFNFGEIIYVHATSRAGDFCESIENGMDIEKVLDMAENDDIECTDKKIKTSKGVLFEFFGTESRFSSCKVWHSKGTVIDKEFSWGLFTPNE